MPKSFGCQFFFPLCSSLASAALLLSGSGTCTAKVAVVVWALLVSGVRLKSLSSSGLSSAEMAPSAIPIEKATPQSGVQIAASVPTHTHIYIYIYTNIAES